MQYVIPLVDGAYLESEVTQTGTRNNSNAHQIITAINGSPTTGKITIQGRTTGGRWTEIDYTLLSEVEPQKIKSTGQIDEYRFIVEGAPGTGSAIISDTELGESIQPYAFYGETNGMTPEEIGNKISTGSALGAGYDIILLAGQSNMVGQYGPIDQVLDRASPRVLMYGYSGKVLSSATQPLDHNGQNPNTVGLGLSLGKFYAENYLEDGREVVLVPAAKSGTSFGSGFWRSGGEGYDNAVALCNEAVALPGNNRVVIIAWNQGESDRTMTEIEYSSEIVTLASGLRGEIENSTNCAFIASTINPLSTQFSVGVFNATLACQFKIEKSAVVYAGDVSLGADSLHYSAESQRELGYRYCAAIRHANQTTLGFNNETLGDYPDGFYTRDSLSGVLPLVVDSGVSEFTGRYVGFNSSTDTGIFTLTGAKAATCQVVEFRCQVNSGRAGIMLRANKSTNYRDGYLFQINGNSNSLRLIKFTAGSSVQLGGNFPIIPSDYTYYRVSIIEDDLKFEYSNDGITWLTGITINDTSFSGISGGVDLMVGFGTNANQVYFDDIKIGVAVTS